MTAGVGPVSSTKFYIGAAGAIPTSPDLWVEIGDINSLGDISQTFTKVTVESIGAGDSFDLKGTRTFPTFDITLNRNDVDVGQLAVKAASAATRGTLYPFRVLDYDGGVSTWQGEVFGFGPAYGQTNAIRSVKTSISIRPSTFTFTPGT